MLKNDKPKHTLHFSDNSHNRFNLINIDFQGFKKQSVRTVSTFR